METETREQNTAAFEPSLKYAIKAKFMRLVLNSEREDPDHAVMDAAEYLIFELPEQLMEHPEAIIEGEHYDAYSEDRADLKPTHTEVVSAINACEEEHGWNFFLEPEDISMQIFGLLGSERLSYDQLISTCKRLKNEFVGGTFGEPYASFDVVKGHPMIEGLFTETDFYKTVSLLLLPV